MAKLNKKQVLHVANLAKLELTQKEIKTYTLQLSKVIDYISELSHVNTDNIEPVSQTTNLVNVKRKDEIDDTRILSQEETLSGTDKTYNGYFVVKKIIDR